MGEEAVTLMRKPGSEYWMQLVWGEGFEEIPARYEALGYEVKTFYPEAREAALRERLREEVDELRNQEWAAAISPTTLAEGYEAGIKFCADRLQALLEEGGE